jgi:hypothetical protein
MLINSHPQSASKNRTSATGEDSAGRTGEDAKSVYSAHLQGSPPRGNICAQTERQDEDTAVRRMSMISYSAVY